jgi:acyl-CoA synthetase (AMP-forming)/AMP-acid ligase II
VSGLSATSNNFRDALLRGGANLALVTSSEDVTYAQLLSRAERFAERLGPDRKLIFLETANTVDGVTAYFGCLLGEHVTHLYAAEEAHLLTQKIADFAPNILIRGSSVETVSNETPQLHPDLSLLLSTSGSTGASKMVKLSQRNVFSNAVSIAEYLELDSTERAATTLDFAHAFGLSVIHSHIVCSGSLLLTDLSVYDPAFWELFRAKQATSFSGVPYTFEMLQRSTEWAASPSLRYAAQAGGKLGPEQVRRFADLGAAHGWRFQVMYGQTEASPRMAYLPREFVRDYSDCIGRPIPGGKIELLADDGSPIEQAGVQGQLAYSGPNVMMGYAASAADLATDETPEKLLTGDIALLNDAGLYRIVGRAARFVKPFGIRIGLDDAQAIARKAAPTAISTGDDSMIVLAVLRDNDGAALQDAVALVASHFGVPKTVVQPLVLEQMPLLPTGKIDYTALLHSARALRKPASNAHDRNPVITFFSRFATEVHGLLGGQTNSWTSVEQIFETLLNAKELTPSDSFRSLDGDSLSYVSVELALEEYLGDLPAGWESMPIGTLELRKADERVL